MSEEVKDEAPKKKGGKMPIILALVLMLGGGGFFMMKKGGKPVKPEIKLGKEEILLPDEFIVNMLDGHTYVRAKIGLRGTEKFKAEEALSHNAEISDVINSILKTTRPDEIITEAQVKKLKIRVAAALNKIFIDAEPKKPGEGKSDAKKDSKSAEESTNAEGGSNTEKKGDDKKSKGAEPKIPDGWDSAEGPILKVFFKALATQ